MSPGCIVLFGATGYTGEHTARALVARGLRPVLAARSAAKLERLAAELGGLDTQVADVARPDSVRALVGPEDVLVSTVGPFTRWGEPAVQAAVAAGAGYVDSTGEPAFIRRVHDHHGPQAERTGARLLAAFGYDWVPGHVAGALAVQEAGTQATAVEVGYFGGGSTSGGTQASVAQAVLQPSFAFRGGRLRAEPTGLRVGRFTLPGDKQRTAISVGGTEHLGLPAAFPQLQDVDVLLGQAGPHVRAMPVLARASGLALSVPGARRGFSALVGRRVTGSSGGPGLAARQASSSTVVGRAVAADGRELGQVVLRGVDPYTFTFEVLAWAAARLAAGDVDGRGALTPLGAFSLEVLQDAVAGAGLARA